MKNSWPRIISRIKVRKSMNTLILANLKCEILIMLEEDAIEVDIYIAYISAM